MTWKDLSLVGPVVLPALAALLLILVDLLPGARKNGGPFLLALLGTLVSFAYTANSLANFHDGTSGFAFMNTMNVDRTALIVTLVVHGAALFSVLLSRLYLERRGEIDAPEYYAFVLASASGMAMLAAANDLVNVFLGIEILSIPLYILAAMRRTRHRSVEAGFKYLLLGAFASAFLLFGSALLLGASGTTVLSAMPSEIVRIGDPSALAPFGAAMLLVGVLFKIAAVPFHMWTPDVYEGAPTPVTAFMATATKAAAFGILLRLAPVLAAALGADRAAMLLAAIAVLSMLVGNLGALQQRNLKRLLAYSSIAHAGYILVGVAAVVAAQGSAVADEAASAVLYYLAVYGAMNLGAFGVAVVVDRGLDRDAVDDLAGLGKSRPVLAVAMAIFALALAGVPPTAGFLGKLFVFRAAIDAGLVPLAVIAVIASVIGLYYYLRLLLVMYTQAPREGEAAPRGDSFIAAVSIAATAIVLLMGILPDGFVQFVQVAARGP